MSGDALVQQGLGEREERSQRGLEWAMVRALWRRDLMRLVRQKSRLAGALGQPLLFWLAFGAGLSGSFRVPGADLNYFEYFFPGAVAMVVLFSGIFGSMSLINDRQEGFLQAALAAPGSRTSVALGKILGGATVALGQAALFLAAAPLAGFSIAQIAWGPLLALLALSAIGLTALGFALAWVIDSQAGYHGVVSLLLLPLWVLSGAMFPPTGASAWLGTLMQANPVAYLVEGTRRALYGGAVPSSLGLSGSSLAGEVMVVGAFAFLAVALAAALCERR